MFGGSPFCQELISIIRTPLDRKMIVQSLSKIRKIQQKKFVAVGVDDLSDFHKQGMRPLAREPMAS